MSSLMGKRILVVEDEYFIAQDIKRALRHAAAEVVGPISDLSAGLRSVEEGHLDAAILDLNLHGEMSYPIAARLNRAHVPHIFLTGYDGWALPDDYCTSPRLTKPFQAELLVAAIERLLITGAAQ